MNIQWTTFTPLLLALITAGADASVATFVDGIYQLRATDAIQDFYDVRRVEVCKGPQAVHLGRNAMGGAVSIITNDPVPFTTASADLLLGSYDQRRLRAMVNLPLAGDRAALRVAGLASRRDGYTDNVFLDEELDDEDVRSGRAKLLLTPDDDLELVLSAESGHRDDARGMAKCPEADPAKGVNGGVALGGRMPDDPREVTHNLENFADIDTRRYGARFIWALEDVELRALSAWQETDLAAALDIDGTDVDFSTNRPTEHSQSFSQELRLISTTGGPLGWVAGLYYLEEDARQVLDIRLPLLGVRSRPVGAVETEAWALFGQAAYAPAPRWRVTAGLRYGHDRRSIHLVHAVNDPFGATGPAGSFTFTQDDAESWGAPRTFGIRLGYRL